MYIVEQPPRSLDAERDAGAVKDHDVNDDATDVLELYCEEALLDDGSYASEGERHGSNARNDERRTNNERAQSRRTLPTETANSRRRYYAPTNPYDVQNSGDRGTTATQKTDVNRRAPKRRRRRLSAVGKRLTEKAATTERRTWHARWIRDGFETLVYAICNCNEEPNVIFAGLCYQRADLYTMVLRNCNGRRRYWYEVNTARNAAADGRQKEVDDFKRAMLWRSSAIGRSTASPGRDLASFVFQEFCSDKRSLNGLATSPIVITVDDTLADPIIRRQLLYAACQPSLANDYNGQIRRRGIERQLTPPTCRMCRRRSKTVTEDNAGVVTFRCWDHSAIYLITNSAERTRMIDATIVDLQFRRDEVTDDLVCVISVIDDIGANPVCELVLLPSFSTLTVEQTYRTTTRDTSVVNSEAAHACTNCREMHYDAGDLFPSMPAYGASGTSITRPVKNYDTAIGRIVDKLCCMVNAFQR